MCFSFSNLWKSDHELVSKWRKYFYTAAMQGYSWNRQRHSLHFLRSGNLEYNFASNMNLHINSQLPRYFYIHYLNWNAQNPEKRDNTAPSVKISFWIKSALVFAHCVKSEHWQNLFEESKNILDMPLYR